MTVLAFGLLGLVVGSFLNVVILRYGERGISGRSACMHCGKQLRWYDMVPVLSWLLLGGRCRYCRKNISVQYPLVEAATGVLFAFVGAAALPPLATLFALAIVSLLICIFVYDLRHTIIPDIWVWPFCILALVFATSYQLPATSYLLAGPVAALPLFSLWAISHGRWMGFGDVKLALGIGWLLPGQTGLGFPLALFAVMFAFIIGAVISVGLLGITRLVGSTTHLTMKSEVPFGPFLIASTLIVWFAILYNIPTPIFSQI